MPPEFSKTEQVILIVLNDGKNHLRKEMLSAASDCLGDPLFSVAALQQHLHRIRKKLLTIGQDIVCVQGGGMYYRQVRMLGTESGEPRRFSEEMEVVS